MTWLSPVLILGSLLLKQLVDSCLLRYPRLLRSQTQTSFNHSNKSKIIKTKMLVNKNIQKREWSICIYTQFQAWKEDLLDIQEEFWWLIVNERSLSIEAKRKSKEGKALSFRFSFPFILLLASTLPMVCVSIYIYGQIIMEELENIMHRDNCENSKLHYILRMLLYFMYNG